MAAVRAQAASTGWSQKKLHALQSLISFFRTFFRLRLEEVTPNDALHWIAWRETKGSARTVVHDLAVPVRW